MNGHLRRDDMQYEWSSEDGWYAVWTIFWRRLIYDMNKGLRSVHMCNMNDCLRSVDMPYESPSEDGWYRSKVDSPLNCLSDWFVDVPLFSDVSNCILTWLIFIRRPWHVYFWQFYVSCTWFWTVSCSYCWVHSDIDSNTVSEGADLSTEVFIGL